MTALCSPSECLDKDTCALYVDEKRLMWRTYWHFTDYSSRPKIDGKCPAYEPAVELVRDGVDVA